MPELDFEILKTEATARGLTPLLNFKVKITNRTPEKPVRGILLQTQIQIQPPFRDYNPAEQERLKDLFGRPTEWGNTLRNFLWAHVSTVTSAFDESTTVDLNVPCSFDLNISASKYFYGLEAGEAALLFLFSGTVFYSSEDEQLLVSRISWEKEASYRMPVKTWKDLIDSHYPNAGWLCLDRDVFDQLYAYRRQNGLPSWNHALRELLPALSEKEEVVA